MRRRKRYDAETVMLEIVGFAEGPIVSGPEARRLMERVLGADTGFMVFGSPDLAGLNVLRVREQIRQFLRQGLRPGEGQFMPPARVELAPAIVKNEVLVTIDGPLPDLIWFQVIRLMQIAGLARLRLCDCGRVFLKTGKRKACSTKCAKRVYMRRFRAGETEEE
jgi:hypothetical protein